MDGPFAPVPDVAALAHRVAGAHAAPVVLFQHAPFCGTSARAHRALAQLTGQDNQAVETLVGELERLVRENKLRMGEPGRAG